MTSLKMRRAVGWPLLAAVAWLGWGGLAWAASGTVISTAGNGLSLSVDTRWIDGNGYRPIWIDVKSTVVSPADRTVHLEFHVRNQYSRSRHDILVSRDIELPAGSPGVKTILSMPQHFPWFSYNLQVWVDGRHSKALSQPNTGIPIWTGQTSDEGLPNILLVAASAPAPAPAAAAVPAPAVPAPAVPAPAVPAPAVPAPAVPNLAPVVNMVPVANMGMGQVAVGDTTALAALFSLENYQAYQTYTPPGTVAPAQAAPQMPTVFGLPVDRLPTKWIDLSGLDIICITAGAMTELAEQRDRLEALRAWTAAGGNLLIGGMGNDFSGLARVEKSLGLLNTEQPSSQPSADGWSAPDPARNKQGIDEPFSKASTAGQPPAGITFGPDGQPVAANQAAPAAAVTPPADGGAAPFRHRLLGTGVVVGVAADDPLALTTSEWAWLLNTLGDQRWLWYRRHGISANQENTDFWNWLVPGVGMAPVGEFRVLITLFVICIGPLNYFWLKRRGKLHLLVLLVPLCAALITLALFGYAVLVDGLDVRVRTRSYTQIDQRTGQAVCWSRQSYFAGLTPSEGMRFPSDVAVFPIQPEGYGYDSPATQRRLLWSGDEQHLTSGWLTSRKRIQMMTVRSRRSGAGLRVIEADGPEPPRVENRLQTRIQRLLLADSNGEYFRITGLKAGATGRLEPASLKTEREAMRDIYMDRQPRVPDGLTPEQLGSFFGRSYYYYGYRSGNRPPAAIGTSRLEHGIMECYGSGLGFSAVPAPLEPRSYVAIVEQSPEVVPGVPEPRQQAGLHVVVGRW